MGGGSIRDDKHPSDPLKKPKLSMLLMFVSMFAYTTLSRISSASIYSKTLMRISKNTHSFFEAGFNFEHHQFRRY